MLAEGDATVKKVLEINKKEQEKRAAALQSVESKAAETNDEYRRQQSAEAGVFLSGASRSVFLNL